MKVPPTHNYYGRSYSGVFSTVDLNHLGDALVVGDNGSLFTRRGCRHLVLARS